MASMVHRDRQTTDVKMVVVFYDELRETARAYRAFMEFNQARAGETELERSTRERAATEYARCFMDSYRNTFGPLIENPEAVLVTGEKTDRTFSRAIEELKEEQARGKKAKRKAS